MPKTKKIPMRMCIACRVVQQEIAEHGNGLLPVGYTERQLQNKGTQRVLFQKQPVQLPVIFVIFAHAEHEQMILCPFGCHMGPSFFTSITQKREKNQMQLPGKSEIQMNKSAEHILFIPLSDSV